MGTSKKQKVALQRHEGRREEKVMTQLNLSLDDHIADALNSLAESKSLSSEELAREVICSFVRSRDRQRIRDEMRTYAEEMAVHSQEFVGETEAEVDEHLIKETIWAD